MGLTHVTVSVQNPADPSQAWESLFLVDAGATDALAPGSELRKIGIQPVGSRTYELADGSQQEMEYGLARLEWMGEINGGLILFGPDDAEPILGVTSLESAGIVVDPRTQKLKRLPAVPLKKADGDS